MGKEAVVPLRPVSAAGCGVRHPPALFQLSEQDVTSRTGHPGAMGVPGDAKHVLNHGTAHQLWIFFFFKERPCSVQQTMSLAQTWAHLARQMEAFPTASPK